MSTASAAPETLTRIEDAIAFLRASGRDDEADAVESLVPSPQPRRLPPTPPPSAQDLIPIAEAAARLGLSRNAVQRRIESGLLDGVRDERNGYRFVTGASVDRLVEFARGMEVIASFPYYRDAGPIAPDSLLGQMLGYAEDLDGDDERDEPTEGERARA